MTPQDRESVRLVFWSAIVISLLLWLISWMDPVGRAMHNTVG